MFNFNKQERDQEKRNAIRNIILNQLGEEHQATVKKTEESEEFINFKENLLAKDPKAAAISKAITTLKAVAKEVEENLSEVFPNNRYRNLADTYDLECKLSGMVRTEKAKAFPHVYHGFDTWRTSELIDNYLTIYDDLKDVDKIVKAVKERVQ